MPFIFVMFPNVEFPVTASVEERVVAPDTVRLLLPVIAPLRALAPETDRSPEPVIFPLTFRTPLAFKSLFTVVVPVVEDIDVFVDALPMFNVVTLFGSRLNVVEGDVRSPAISTLFAKVANPVTFSVLDNFAAPVASKVPVATSRDVSPFIKFARSLKAEVIFTLKLGLLAEVAAARTWELFSPSVFWVCATSVLNDTCCLPAIVFITPGIGSEAVRLAMLTFGFGTFFIKKKVKKENKLRPTIFKALFCLGSNSKGLYNSVNSVSSL